MKIPFIKAHGAGNDFIIIDKNVDIIKKSKKMIKKLCDRRFGIGCDQLILLKKYPSYHRVYFYNSDGSLGKNCGNGLRCVYKYLSETKKYKKVIIKSHNFSHLGTKIGKDYKINVGDFLSDYEADKEAGPDKEADTADEEVFDEQDIGDTISDIKEKVEKSPKLPRNLFLYLLPKDSQVSSIRNNLFFLTTLSNSPILTEFPSV